MSSYRWEPYPIRFHAAQKTLQEWNQYQGIINTLHTEGQTQKQIRATLENNYGFTISIGQLRKRLLQAPPRNTASIPSSLPTSRARCLVGKSRPKLVEPQQVPESTDSSVAAASQSSSSHHVLDPPICHLDESSAELSNTKIYLPNSDEKVFRELTTILDEGFDVDSCLEEVSPVVGTGGFEPDQQQSSQINISAPELPDTVLTHYQAFPQTTANTLHTISNPDGLCADMEVYPSSDLSDNVGSIMSREWAETIGSKQADDYSTDLWPVIRVRRARNKEATSATATSGMKLAFREVRVRTRVCCVCEKPGASDICRGCQHARYSGYGSIYRNVKPGSLTSTMEPCQQLIPEKFPGRN